MRAGALPYNRASSAGSKTLAVRRRTELLFALGLVPLVLTLLVLQALDRREFAHRQVGIYLEEPPDQPGLIRITGLVPGLPGETDGLKPGDVVRTLNGKVLRNSADMDPIMRAHTGSVVYGI